MLLNKREEVDMQRGVCLEAVKAIVVLLSNSCFPV